MRFGADTEHLDNWYTPGSAQFGKTPLMILREIGRSDSFMMSGPCRLRGGKGGLMVLASGQLLGGDFLLQRSDLGRQRLQSRFLLL
jgi:hypothetical protein